VKFQKAVHGIATGLCYSIEACSYPYQKDNLLSQRAKNMQLNDWGGE
jgi:hypothetical protein